MNDKRMCKGCGMPDSYPIPHHHSFSEREQLIYDEMKRRIDAAYLEGVRDASKDAYGENCIINAYEAGVHDGKK